MLKWKQKRERKLLKLADPLFEAASNGNATQLKKLIAKGASVNSKRRCGETPLHAAAEANAAECVAALLACHADPNVQNGDGRTPLHAAAEANVVECVAALLAGHADPNVQNDWGETPLHAAAKANAAECVAALLAGHADPNVQSCDGRTPLHVAAEANTAECVAALLAGHADPNVQNVRGETPLHDAAEANAAECVAALLAGHADPNVQSFLGSTSLHICCYRGKSKAAQVLVTWAKTDLTIRNKEGKTALKIAIKTRNFTIRDLIIKRQEGHLTLKHTVKDQTEVLRKHLQDQQQKLRNKNEEVHNLRQMQEQIRRTEAQHALMREGELQDELEIERVGRQRAQEEVQELHDQLRTVVKSKDDVVAEHQKCLDGKEKLLKYELSPQKTGLLKLVANSTFADSEARPGTDKDVTATVEVFRQLGYRIFPDENCTAEEIRDILTATANDKKHQSSNCLVVVLLSHGGVKGVMGVDGENITEKEIIKILGSSKVWAGKPKLVLIQACRGGDRLGKVQVPVEGAVGGAPDPDVSDASDDAEEDATVPATTDMLVAQATPDGFIALRSRRSGSYFIQFFAQHLRDYARTCDVDGILKMVTSDVVAKREGYDRVCVPSISHNTLRKLFYLA